MNPLQILYEWWYRPCMPAPFSETDLDVFALGLYHLVADSQDTMPIEIPQYIVPNVYG